MLLTTIQRVKMLGDEFENVTDERIELYIEDASFQVSSFLFPEEHKERLARYLAAHLIALSIRTEQAVIREKVDVIERQYSDPNKNLGLLATKFGQMYEQMLEDLEAQFNKKKGVNLWVM